MIAYFLEANLCLLLFGGIYYLFLRKEQHFQLVRLYLVGITILSLLIPLLHFNNPFSENFSLSAVNELSILSLPAVSPEAENGVITESAAAGINWSWPVVAMLSYAAVVFILLILFCIQLFQVYRLRILQKPYIKKEKGYLLIPTNGQWPTFSFFNMLFFDETTSLTDMEKQKVLEHEQVHIRQKHTIDVLFIEGVKIVFWINPMVWMIRSSIEQVHEYLADEKILKHTNEDYYSSLLAKMILKQMSLPVGLHFNRSVTLKRIKMMKTPKRKIQTWKWGSVFSIVLLIGIAFSCNDEVEMINDVKQSAGEDADEIFDVLIQEAPKASEAPEAPKVMEETDEDEVLNYDKPIEWIPEYADPGN